MCAMSKSFTAEELSYLKEWVGKSEHDEDVIAPRVVRQMAGLLGLDSAPAEGDPLPLPWHWLFFNPVPHAYKTGEDGHPAKGGFLPPVPLPRRMWAGSRVECFGSLIVGEKVKRVSRIESVNAKQGRSGSLVIVTVIHETFSEKGVLVLRETQDLVYKEASTAPYKASNKPPAEVPTPIWQSQITPDPVMLFRFSALTFNGHRIHYDRDYAVQEECYPALVVHGPLTASLLINLLYQNVDHPKIAGFQFKGLSPLFDTDSFSVQGHQSDDGVQLLALNHLGQMAMSMDVTLENGF